MLYQSPRCTMGQRLLASNTRNVRCVDLGETAEARKRGAGEAFRLLPELCGDSLVLCGGWHLCGGGVALGFKETVGAVVAAGLGGGRYGGEERGKRAVVRVLRKGMQEIQQDLHGGVSVARAAVVQIGDGVAGVSRDADDRAMGRRQPSSRKDG